MTNNTAFSYSNFRPLISIWYKIELGSAGFLLRFTNYWYNKAIGFFTYKLRKLRAVLFCTISLSFIWRRFVREVKKRQ